MQEHPGLPCTKGLTVPIELRNRSVRIMYMDVVRGRGRRIGIKGLIHILIR
jgi:hypothetical protein